MGVYPSVSLGVSGFESGKEGQNRVGMVGAYPFQWRLPSTSVSSKCATSCYFMSLISSRFLNSSIEI